MEEMARWLSDGAKSAPAVIRQTENQVELWFQSGHGSERQRKRLRRVARDFEDHRTASVRAHARRLGRIRNELLR